jgi:uncharacterized protein
MTEHIFFNKTLFFPEKGILAIGDLHLGFEYQLQQSGVLVPERQVKEIIEELKEIFKEIKEKNFNLNKIVFLGDIKHSFSYEWKEKNYFNEIISFLKEYVNEKDIILIKGNHDKMDYSGKKMKNYLIKDRVCFVHGHMAFPEIYDKGVKTIVMGHLHPSVIISDKANVKREKFKCFLVGKFHDKKIIILPSFFETIEGTSVNDYGEDYQNYFSIVPKDVVMNSEIFVIGKDEIYDFGKVKNLD